MLRGTGTSPLLRQVSLLRLPQVALLFGDAVICELSIGCDLTTYYHDVACWRRLGTIIPFRMEVARACSLRCLRCTRLGHEAAFCSRR